MAETEVRVVLADAVVVGPEDRLVVRVAEDWTQEVVEELLMSFKDIGIDDRVLILWGDVEFAKVAKE